MTARHAVGWGARAVGAALLAASATAGAQELTWNGSLGYATGEYIFTERFHSFSLLNALAFRAGRLELSASLPVVVQDGTTLSLVAGVPVPTGGPDNGAVQRRQSGQPIGTRGGKGSGSTGTGRTGQGTSGPGRALLAEIATDESLTVTGAGSYVTRVADPVFGGRLALYEGIGLVRSLGIEGWAKAPLASVESGVGTGAWDYGAGSSLALAVGGTILFADAAWWMLGDMPELELRNALFYSLAMGRTLNARWSVLVSGSASTQLVDGSDPPASLGVLVARQLGRGASVSLSLSAGVTESAAAFTAGLGWSTRLLSPGR